MGIIFFSEEGRDLQWPGHSSTSAGRRRVFGRGRRLSRAQQEAFRADGVSGGMKKEMTTKTGGWFATIVWYFIGFIIAYLVYPNFVCQ